MNIISRNNQRAVLHLSRIGKSAFYIARAIVFTETFNGSYTSHVVGVKRLNESQAQELRLAALAQTNVTFIDATVRTDVAVISHFIAINGSVVPTSSDEKGESLIPSPYTAGIKTLEELFSIQKPRAPTAR